MNSPTPLSHRSENLERGRALQTEAQTALKPYNYDLSEFESHEALTLFGINSRSQTGASLVIIESSAPIDPNRHQFRRDNVDGRIIDLGATAFGRSIKELGAHPHYASWFEESRLNPGVHMTWTPRPIKEKEVAFAAPELAFAVAHGSVPEDVQLERIYEVHQPVIEEIAHAFRAFAEDAGPLQDALELKRPTTPNSVVIRWDIEGSTEFMTDDELEPIAANYLRDLKKTIAQILNGRVHATVDGGDGQNIIITIPSAIDLANPESVKKFERLTIQPILDAMSFNHTKLLGSYSELGPLHMTLSAATGYVDPSQDDYIDNAVLWRVARSLKQK